MDWELSQFQTERMGGVTLVTRITFLPGWVASASVGDAPGLVHLELRGRMLSGFYEEIFWCHQRVVSCWSHHRGPKAARHFITTSSLGAVTM